MPSVTQAPKPRTHAPRTLWEEGRHPGALVVPAAVVALAVAVLLSLLVGDRIGALFDTVFVLTCLGAALAVRPRDFFTVGVLPPLLLAATVLVLTVTERGAVARADDSVPQALVSGLAHHALALVLGYGLALTVLALRQVALRNSGRLRRTGSPRTGGPKGHPSAASSRASLDASSTPRVPQQPGGAHDEVAPEQVDGEEHEAPAHR